MVQDNEAMELVRSPEMAWRQVIPRHSLFMPAHKCPEIDLSAPVLHCYWLRTCKMGYDTALESTCAKVGGI